MVRANHPIGSANQICACELPNRFGQSNMCVRISQSMRPIKYVRTNQPIGTANEICACKPANQICACESANRYGQSNMCVQISQSIRPIKYVPASQPIGSANQMCACKSHYDRPTMASKFFGCHASYNSVDHFSTSNSAYRLYTVAIFVLYSVVVAIFEINLLVEEK